MTRLIGSHWTSRSQNPPVKRYHKILNAMILYIDRLVFAVRRFVGIVLAATRCTSMIVTALVIQPSNATPSPNRRIVDTIMESVSYGETLGSVVQRLEELRIKHEVLPSSAMPPDHLRAMMEAGVIDKVDIDRIEYEAVHLVGDIELFLNFNHNRKLIGFTRVCNGFRADWGKSIHAMKVNQEVTYETSTENTHSATGKTDPIADPSANQVASTDDTAPTLPKIENSILFGDGIDDVISKLKKMGISAFSSSLSPLSEEELEHSDVRNYQGWEQAHYFEVDISKEIGLLFMFNLEKKLVTCVYTQSLEKLDKPCSLAAYQRHLESEFKQKHDKRADE